MPFHSRHLGCSFCLMMKFTPDLATEGSSLLRNSGERKGKLDSQVSAHLWFFFLLQKKEPQALISEGSESVYRVNSFPQKVNHNQLVTRAHKISKQEKGFQTGNKQKSEFYTSTPQNIFSSQGPIAFPNFQTWTLNQVLLLLLSALLIERKNLFGPTC